MSDYDTILLQSSTMVLATEFSADDNISMCIIVVSFPIKFCVNNLCIIELSGPILKGLS